jgi:hypothetical protein
MECNDFHGTSFTTKLESRRDMEPFETPRSEIGLPDCPILGNWSRSEAVLFLEDRITTNPCKNLAASEHLVFAVLRSW